MPIETGPVPALLDRAASLWPDKPAIEYHDRKISFSALAGMVDRMAAGLMRLGIGPGRPIALFLPNTPWHSVCFFAALKVGARLVHLSPLDAPRELAHKVMDSGADVVITTDMGGLGVGAVRFVEAGLAKLLLVGQDAFWGGSDWPQPDYGEAVQRLDGVYSDEMPQSWPAIDPEQVALLQYTGGTTGMPKGAMLSHRNLTAATSIYRAWRDTGIPGPGEQRVIGVLPMFHIYALEVILLVSVAEGNEILLRPRFDVATTLRDITEKRATSLAAVPTMLVALLAEPRAAGMDFSSLALVGSGGAPMPHEVALKVEGLLGQRAGARRFFRPAPPAQANKPASISRSSFFCTLPIALRGRLSTMRTCLGTLKPAIDALSAATSASGSSTAPARGTTTATTASPKSGCGTPTTADSATPGNSSRRPSISAG